MLSQCIAANPKSLGGLTGGLTLDSEKIGGSADSESPERTAGEDTSDNARQTR